MNINNKYNIIYILILFYIYIYIIFLVHELMNISTQGIRRKNPINRNNFFTSSASIDMQIGIGMEYVNKILNQTVVLYQVDIENSNINDIYQESNFEDIHFKTPIELNVMYKLNPGELKTYDTSAIKAYYVKVGQLEFQVYQKELEENDCDIRRGDYIGVQVTPERMEFFIVADDGRVNYDNRHTMFGTVPYFRSIKCTAVSDKTETKNL